MFLFSLKWPAPCRWELWRKPHGKNLNAELKRFLQNYASALLRFSQNKPVAAVGATDLFPMFVRIDLQALVGACRPKHRFRFKSSSTYLTHFITSFTAADESTPFESKFKGPGTEHRATQPTNRFPLATNRQRTLVHVSAAVQRRTGIPIATSMMIGQNPWAWL